MKSATAPNARVELLPAQHRFERAEDRERPPAQRFAFVLRDAEHVADQRHRNGGGKIPDEIDLSLGRRLFQEPVDELLDPVLQAPAMRAA